MKTLFGFILTFFYVECAFAQLGGSSTYQFLTLQPNARVTTLAGTPIANPDNDLNLSLVNPSLLNREMSNQITYNYMRYMADISASYAGVAHHFDSVGTFALGIQSIHYGSFKKTAANGEILGEFSAGEYAIHASAARTYGSFSVGFSVKFIESNLEEYRSYGLALDGGVTYFNRKNLLTLAAVVTNYGRQFKPYRDGNNEPLPMNVQLGISKKFLHNPLRFSMTVNHLENPFGLLYQNAGKPGLKKDLETGQIIPETFGFGQKVLSHLTFSAEILLGKNFYTGLGYNYLRRWEMKLEDIGGFTGFSWGFGLRVTKIQVAYAYSGYHTAYGTHHFSFIVNVNDFLKKKKA